MTQAVHPSEGATLARELADFLVELSIALHKHAIYPPGHPLVHSAANGVRLRLETLLHDRTTLSLGVARQQLVIEGVATDPDHPLLRDLATRLYRQHLGAIRFNKGVTTYEVAGFLSTVAADPSRMDQPLGLGPREALREWKHVRLFPLTYGHLELVDEEESAEHVTADGRSRGSSANVAQSRAAQLWIGLARAAMAAESEEKPSAEQQDAQHDPVIVAKAIDEHQREVAYDQVIVGYLLQIAQELRSSGGTDNLALSRRVSQLVNSLSPETLRELMRMGGDAGQRKRFVLDAAQGMALDAVLDLVKAAGESSNGGISQSLLRLLSKLAVHAEHGALTMRPVADVALREHVGELLSGWDLEEPMPRTYRLLLDRISSANPVFAPTEHATLYEALRVAMMSLETGSAGTMVWDAVDEVVSRGGLKDIIAQLDAAPEDRREVVDAFWRHLASDDTVRRELQRAKPEFAVVDRLVSRLQLSSADALLDALEAAEERTTRWKLMEQIIRLGPEVGVKVAERIPGAHWFVQRNLLLLIGRLPAWPPGFSPLPYATHLQWHVRREALKLMLKEPSMREQALYAGLVDADARVVHMTLLAAAESSPRGVAPLLRDLLTKAEPLDADSRALALRALAPLQTHETVETLLRFVLGGRSIMGKPKLAPKTPEMLAALGGLATHWKNDQRALSVLMLAARSGDADVRAVIMPGKRMSTATAPPR